jgi:hypothetical protein
MLDRQGWKQGLLVRAVVGLTIVLLATADAAATFLFPVLPAAPRAESRADPGRAPQVSFVYRITVPGSADGADGAGPSSALFERDALAGRAAALGDPFRALAGTAGIAARSDLSSELRIRGGEAGDTAVLVDGLPLPTAYHFAGGGGSTTTLQTDLVQRAQVHAGGFSAEFGDALAGVVDLVTRDERPERPAGRWEISTLQGRATLAAPAGGGAWFLSARASDLGLYGNHVEDGVESVAFQDLSASLRLPTAGSGRLDLLILQGGSRYAESLDQVRDGSLTDDHRGGRLRFEAPLDGRTYLKVLLSRGHASTRSAVTGGASYDGRQARDDLKISVLRLLGEDHRLLAGLDLSRTRGLIEGTVTDGYTLVDSRTEDDARTEGIYVEDLFAPDDRLALRCGLRGDRFSPTGESVLSPRFGLDFRLGETWTLRGAAGRFVQFARPEQVFLAAGEPLRHQTADHFILGVERRSSSGARVSLEAYVKRLDDPIGESANRFIDFPERMTGFDSGSASGADLVLEGAASGPWRWRLDYGHLVARQEEAGVSYPRDTDQRHAATALLGRRFGAGWDLSGVLRYGSGLPYTPQTAWTNGVSEWMSLGKLNDARLPIYHRLDLRLARSVRLSKGTMSFYVELLNVYNRGNVRSVDLTLDDDTHRFYRAIRYQTPFLPAFGLAADF